MRIVAIEEHFWTPKIRDLYTGRHALKSEQRARKLAELGHRRLQEMDAAGIDLQVLSLVQPGVQIFDAPEAATLAREMNDVLYQTMLAHPGRFSGFAALPTADPDLAADELERTVTEYGFVGAMVAGLTNGEFLDEKRFWPIFQRAEALGVPIYLHPAIPHDDVIAAYYERYPILFGAAWGFGVETATHAVRMIMSGVFDAFPNLRVILGHFGEGLPFLANRVNTVVGPTGLLPRSFNEYFKECFYVTTSSDFTYPAMTCVLEELGPERVMFAVDWPYRDNQVAVDYVQNAPISDTVRNGIFHGNAERLLALPSPTTV